MNEINMKQILVSALLLLLCGQAMAQCDKIKTNSLGTRKHASPDWVNNVDLPNDKLPKSELKAFTGVGVSHKAAEADMELKMKKFVSQKTGLRVRISSDSGDDQTRSTDELSIKARPVSNYWEECKDGTIYYSTLWQISNNPTSQWYDMKNVSLSTRYGVGVRPFIPGMAQFYKGQTGKGVTFVILESVFLAAGAGLAFFANSQYDVIGTHTSSDKVRNQEDDRYFYSNYKMSMQLANGAFAVAGVVYLINIIDGYTSRPKTQRIRVAAVPTVNPNGIVNGGAALTMSIKF
ncbi:hypothetical protein FACS1894199_17470 [Bacteroidia bacterium]|nr:hypothetical protein FACS1894199_17470 [Bacteroidia bacterium]